MKKVIVSKEVADAIEVKRNSHWNNYDIIHAYIDGDAGTAIHNFVGSSNGSFDALISALVNGYEVEKTPEYKVREYYESIVELFERHEESYDNGTLRGVKQTLNLLGITIEGIND